MPLLVSTPLHLFLVDENTRKTSILRSGNGYYFGITHKENLIVLSHSGGYLQFFNLKTQPQPLRTSRHLLQPHQIELVEDIILVTNTGRNCISVYSEKGKFHRDVYLNEIRWDDKNANRLGNHFNTVHKEGDKVYVVAHNYERPSEIWELSWPELEVQDVKPCNAGWAHNIWISEYGTVICDSKNNGLFNVSTNKHIWHSDKKGTMTRGLAVSEQYLFVGYSSFSERHDRYWKSGGIWVIDRNSLKTIEQIPIPGSGDVNEIRILDIPDESHNGHILKSKSLESLRSESLTISLAYHIRKRYSFFQHNIFPISQLIRFVNILPRWKDRFYRRNLIGK